jgi:hypothetical protein
MTSEMEIGKKPTTISKKGIRRGPMGEAPYFSTKPVLTLAVKFISQGKIRVNITMGQTIRQSRRLSRNSRLVTIKAMARKPCPLRIFSEITDTGPPHSSTIFK